MKYFIYCRKSSESEDRQILSVDSQYEELKRAFGALPDVEIVGIFRESASAKAPGRLIFNELLLRIEAGEAQGILAWHPDRLARNSIDGGRIIYLLDQKVLQGLRFATFTFENNPQGKFMLSITFGYSKYYVDSLSENVKRGNRAKIEKGWRPSRAPLGYLNDRETTFIIQDPIRFPLVRKMFDLALTGTYGPKEIALKARNEWGFVTPTHKRIGGKPVSLSTVYKILGNPFYAGLIVWNGEVYPGKHDPVVTLAEFDRVRAILGRPGRPQPQKYRFAFTGMMRCGACGLMITAENRVKRARRYTYYHCTKRHLGDRCKQPSIELKTLESQIQEFLETVYVPPHVHDVATAQLHEGMGRHAIDAKLRTQSLDGAINSVTMQLKELTGLRVRNLLNDTEFIERRAELTKEQLRLTESRHRVDSHPSAWFEPVSGAIYLRNMALEWFRYGDMEMKKLILETIGSNPTLTAKKLSIETRKPFRRRLKNEGISQVRALIENIRNDLFKDEALAALIQRNVKLLRELATKNQGTISAVPCDDASSLDTGSGRMTSS
jgi:site-specific DNA recombinase